MRRGWVLLSVIAFLLVTACFSWWWSTPAQLWWMNVKIRHRVIPMQDDVPWGGDRMAMIDIMDPQWSRLIERGYVRWYCRDCPGKWTSEQMSTFWTRVDQEIRFPAPYHAVGGIGIGEDSTSIEYLLPPDQHAALEAILRDVVGEQFKDIQIREDSWRPSLHFEESDTYPKP